MFQMGYLSSNTETRIQRASSWYPWQIAGYPDSDIHGIIHLLDSYAMIVPLKNQAISSQVSQLKEKFVCAHEHFSEVPFFKCRKIP